MKHSRKLFGGVVATPGQDSQAVVALLSHYVRDRLELAYYAHPKEIDLHRRHDFLIVLSVGDLEGVARLYTGNGHAAPVIVHIDEPAILQHIDHARFFPGLEIVSIEQANLTAQPDVTLRLDLFRRVVESLEARV